VERQRATAKSPNNTISRVHCSRFRAVCVYTVIGKPPEHRAASTPAWRTLGVFRVRKVVSMTIAPLSPSDTSTRVDVLFSDLHDAIPGMSNDELISTFHNADDLRHRAWLVQAHCIYEARERGSYGDNAVEAVARGFEITRAAAYELARVWEAFAPKLLGHPNSVVLPKSFYVEALEAEDPVKWVEHAEDQRAANPFYTVRTFKDEIAADKQERAASALRAESPTVATVERYGVIVADPPWLYEQATTTLQGTTGHHYRDLSIDDLCTLPVSQVAAKDSILILWCTWPQLTEALRLVEAWGFKYVTGFPWIKITGQPQVNLAGAINARPQYGVGFWTRGCSEPILIARRGNVSPPKNGWVGLLSQNFQHSRKPENIYDFAESIPGPYLELFGDHRHARHARPVRLGGALGLHARREDEPLARPRGSGALRVRAPVRGRHAGAGVEHEGGPGIRRLRQPPHLRGPPDQHARVALACAGPPLARAGARRRLPGRLDSQCGAVAESHRSVDNPRLVDAAGRTARCRVGVAFVVTPTADRSVRGKR
jgi:N6-adenosine-specific RNA methylase IME4